MSNWSTQYYCDDVELKSAYPLKTARFIAIGGVPSRHNRYDGYNRLVGHPAVGGDACMPVTRKIYYKRNPSLHKCDARCMNARGHDCECSCGGANHGIGAR